MLEKLVLHGVREVKYSTDEQVYKVTRPTTGTVDIDGFIDEIIINDTGHASVTFSVGEET